MNTNTTRRIANIVEKRRPLGEKIADVEASLKSLCSAFRQLEGHRNYLLLQVNDPKIIAAVQEIDLNRLLFSINTEIKALDKLKVRFCRDTLKIGVVGRARQGKSRLLQSLTGLSAAEIPDGDRENSTAVRSTIYHHPSVETHAQVWFHSERSLLDQVIHPYYDKLSLGTKPVTIDDFASKPLPPLPSFLPEDSQAGIMYEYLKNYHTNIEKYRHLLRLSSPHRISQDEICEYVAQNTPDGERIFKYLAVEEVEIFCQFPHAEIGQIAFVDMPALGDTGISNEQHLIRTLGQDVDVVLFVRMPKSSEDCWTDVDGRLYETARTASIDLPLNLWSFAIANSTDANSSYGDNSKLCADLAQNIAKTNINFVNCLTANCANTQEVNKVLEQVIDYLATNITELDQKNVFLYQQRLFLLQSQVNTELEKISKVLEETKQNPHELALFDLEFAEIWQEIKNGFEKLLKEFKKKQLDANTDLKKQVEAVLQVCRTDTRIPTIKEIEKRYEIENSYEIVYEKYLNEIRAHLSQNLLLLDDGLKRSLDQMKSQVAKVLIEKGGLGEIMEAKGSEFLQKLAVQIPDQLMPGIPSKLKLGLQTLAEFELSYRGFVQYRIRPHLDGLTPNEPKTIKLTASPSPRQVLLSLKIAHAQSLAKCEKALKELLCEPNQVAFALVEEFLDRTIHAADAESEWRLFLREVRSPLAGASARSHQHPESNFSKSNTPNGGAKSSRNGADGFAVAVFTR